MIPSTQNAGLTGEKPFVIPSEEITRRRLNIQKTLKENRIDGLIIVQRVDLYFSAPPRMVFFIPAEGGSSSGDICHGRRQNFKNIIGINSARMFLPYFIYGRFPDVLASLMY
jgi:hypothetical protein